MSLIHERTSAHNKIFDDSAIEQRPRCRRVKLGGARQRRKGDRIEREIVDRHRALGVHAERYPLSGASRFRGSGHDIDIYAFGTEGGPLIAEVKARKSGSGFVTLEVVARRLRHSLPPQKQRRSAHRVALACVGALA